MLNRHEAPRRSGITAVLLSRPKHGHWHRRARRIDGLRLNKRPIAGAATRAGLLRGSNATVCDNRLTRHFRNRHKFLLKAA